jgi:hypothetical protein
MDKDQKHNSFNEKHGVWKQGGQKRWKLERIFDATRSVNDVAVLPKISFSRIELGRATKLTAAMSNITLAELYNLPSKMYIELSTTVFFINK